MRWTQPLLLHCQLSRSAGVNRNVIYGSPVRLGLHLNRVKVKEVCLSDQFSKLLETLGNTLPQKCPFKSTNLIGCVQTPNHESFLYQWGILISCKLWHFQMTAINLLRPICQWIGELYLPWLWFEKIITVHACSLVLTLHWLEKAHSWGQPRP